MTYMELTSHLAQTMWRCETSPGHKRRRQEAQEGGYLLSSAADICRGLAFILRRRNPEKIPRKELTCVSKVANVRVNCIYRQRTVFVLTQVLRKTQTQIKQHKKLFFFRLHEHLGQLSSVFRALIVMEVNREPFRSFPSHRMEKRTWKYRLGIKIQTRPKFLCVLRRRL